MVVSSLRVRYGLESLVNLMSNLQQTSSIEEVEGKLMSYEQVDCPLKHHFSPGVYMREITMPAGSIILGHEHITKHLNIISKGSCRLLDIETGEVTILEAPYTFESEAGVRKLLYIIEECVWSTVHVTEETDLDTLEEELIIHSEIHKELEGGLVYGMGSSRSSSSKYGIKYSRTEGSS